AKEKLGGHPHELIALVHNLEGKQPRQNRHANQDPDVQRNDRVDEPQNRIAHCDLCQSGPRRNLSTTKGEVAIKTSPTISTHSGGGAKKYCSCSSKFMGIPRAVQRELW